MRRVLLALCAVAVLVPALATASGSSRARVWVSDRSPLVVRGTGFKAHEHVVVSATAGRRFVRSVTAGAGGSFVVSWTSVDAAKSYCVTLAIRAVGNLGSVATFKVPGIECANGPIDPGP
jgi:hypothetical protein